jgi:ferredoxin
VAEFYPSAENKLQGYKELSISDRALLLNRNQMKVFENKTIDPALELRAILINLPFQCQQAWMFSSHYMTSYLQEHVDNEEGFSSDQAAMMAAGRLEWLLRESRPTLSGLFTESDVFTLMECYRDSMFFPDQMNCIASDLCDHLGVELFAHETSGIAPLIDKLVSLSPVQRVTLADALEQTWYRGMGKEQKQPREFLASMGILLK